MPRQPSRSSTSATCRLRTLTPNPRNARIHPKKQIAKLKARSAGWVSASRLSSMPITSSSRPRPPSGGSGARHGLSAR